MMETTKRSTTSGTSNMKTKTFAMAVVAVGVGLVDSYAMALMVKFCYGYTSAN